MSDGNIAERIERSAEVERLYAADIVIRNSVGLTAEFAGLFAQSAPRREAFAARSRSFDFVVAA